MQTNGTINDDLDSNFPLNDPENVIKLNIILDELIEELESDKKAFTTIFKNLPLNIYLKIDALRNASLEKKSKDFKVIATKAKYISKEFHNQYK